MLDCVALADGDACAVEGGLVVGISAVDVRMDENVDDAAVVADVN